MVAYYYWDIMGHHGTSWWDIMVASNVTAFNMAGR